jgi:hypothetical protein
MPPKSYAPAKGVSCFQAHVHAYEERRKVEPDLAAIKLYLDFSNSWLQYIKNPNSFKFKGESEQSIYNKLTLFLNDLVQTMESLLKRHFLAGSILEQ